MPAKKNKNCKPLTGKALIKEVCLRIRLARSRWDYHNNKACRREREKAMELYESLSKEERKLLRMAALNDLIDLHLLSRIKVQFNQPDDSVSREDVEAAVELFAKGFEDPR